MDGGKFTAAFAVPGDVSDAVRSVIADADDRGWSFRLYQQRRERARYWCPCGRHEVWIDLFPKTVDYVDRLRRRLIGTTCWEE